MSSTDDDGTTTTDTGNNDNDNDDDDPDQDYYFAGVPSSAEDLYLAMLFLTALFLVGDVFCKRVLRIVPPLVGYIGVGIAFGPQGLDWVRPSPPEAWVLLGNLGLVLLIVQAGLEMDYATLRLVGPRGVVIAVVGSVLPISVGTAVASVYLDGWRSALAAGCCFGPTSAGIAMNVLGQCHVLQRAVGQLIVAAAIVDDMIALVVLSQLKALTTDNPSVGDVVVPIVSAILWLFVGGAIALLVFPHLLDRVLSLVHTGGDANGSVVLVMTLLFAMVFALLPATYLTEASYLMGGFLAGLAFCQDTTGLDALFTRQFKRIIQWLMKIFFAATIGFQVPVRSFGDGTVILRGLFFVLALSGKLAVGLLTPDFYREAGRDGPGHVGRYRGNHLRDCLVVGFSMMGEAEFAFVLAVFGVSEGLVPPDVYASIVLAILLSTIISPLLLRSTLAIAPYDTDDKKEATPNTTQHDNITGEEESNLGDLDGHDSNLRVVLVQIMMPVHEARTVKFLTQLQNVLVSELKLAVINQRSLWCGDDGPSSETATKEIGAQSIGTEKQKKHRTFVTCMVVAYSDTEQQLQDGPEEERIQECLQSNFVAASAIVQVKRFRLDGNTQSLGGAVANSDLLTMTNGRIDQELQDRES